MRRNIALVSGLCLSALALSACNDPGARADRPNSAICVRFNQPNANTPAPTLQEGPAAVEDCVQRWAYNLAPSRDEAAVVADAVLAACTAPLTRWNQQAVAQAAPEAEGASITTGQPTNPVAEHYSFTRARALFYVVQARAGRCAPPPANANNNGQANG